jgi:protein-disulfide isomerase
MSDDRQSSSSTSTRSLLVPALALVAAIALAVAAFAGGGDSEGAEQGDQEQALDEGGPDVEEGQATEERAELLAQLERREEGDPLALGDVDAPVLMIEWADFQCPFCGAFARDTKPELIDRYVDEGLLRIEWRDFAILGEESQTAALGGRAAAEQDAFWELHDEIFAHDRERNAGELAKESLIEMADELGLDAERFAEDFGDPTHQRAAQEDLQLGDAIGITATPAFLINGQPVIGGQPTEVFIEAIDRALAEAGAA